MAHPQDAADTVDLGRAGRAIQRGWRLIAVCTLLGGLVALAIVRYARPKFEGNSTLILRTQSPDTKSSLLAQAQGIAGSILPIGASSPLETELGILDSRAVAASVVDSLHLTADVLKPSDIPVARVVAAIQPQPSFAPRLYTFVRKAGAAASYSVQSGTLTTTATPGVPVDLPTGSLTLAASPSLPDRFELLVRDRDDAITALLDNLDVQKTKGELVKLSYTAGDSITAAAVPNAIVAAYMVRRATTDRGVNQRRVEFLSGRLDSLNATLAERENALRNQEATTGVLDPIEVGRLELERSSKMRGDLTDIEVERAAAQRLIDGVTNHTITPRQITAFPTFIRGSGLSGLLTQLTQVESQRDELLGTRTTNDPQVMALDSAAKNLEAQLLPLTQTYVASLAQQQRGIERQFDSLDAVIAKLPATAQVAGRLQRDILEISKLGAGVQAQMVDAQLAAIGEGGDVHPLDVATVPRLPVFPRPKLLTAVGLAGGWVVGALLALLMASFGRWVQDPLEVERSTGVPALRFDPAAPLIVSGSTWRTVLVAPIDDSALVKPVVERLLRTAASRSISATVLDLTSTMREPMRVSTSVDGNGTRVEQQTDVLAAITALERDHEMVIVQLPGLVSDAAAAALSPSRPVLLVTAERRVNRSRLSGAVQLLKRLDVPCAGIVMSGGPASLRAGLRPRLRTTSV